MMLTNGLGRSWTVGGDVSGMRDGRNAGSARRLREGPCSRNGNLRPLGPEAGPGETARSARRRTEAEGLGNTGARGGPPDALGALSASTVTQHGEPVGIRLAANLLRAALKTLGRDGHLTGERLGEVEELIRGALRALADMWEP